MTETLTKKLITFSKVKKVVRESLALEDDVQITAQTKLADLKAESIDILDIYFKLGMNFMEYTSGEKLNAEGIKLLEGIADAYLYHYKYGKYSDVNHFSELAMSKNTNEFINQLCVGDLVTIKNYEIEKGIYSFWKNKK